MARVQRSSSPPLAGAWHRGRAAALALSGVVALSGLGGAVWLRPADRAPPAPPERGAEAAPRREGPRGTPVMSAELPVRTSTDGLARLEVEVHAGGAPAPHVGIVGPACGVRARADAAGRTTLLLPPGWCVLEAAREDGLVLTRGPRVGVALEAGQARRLRLELPAEPSGGLGLRVQSYGGALRVDEVLPGGPAGTAGIQRGDSLVEVDGVPAAELDPETFVELSTGPVGEPVMLVVADPAGGPPRRLTVGRAFLQDPDPDGVLDGLTAEELRELHGLREQLAALRATPGADPAEIEALVEEIKGWAGPPR